MESFSGLRQKEVINICDGMRLGFVDDLEFDIRTARICNLIIVESFKCFGLLGHEREYCIPWGCIKKIGDDIILIDVRIDEVLRNC